MFVVTPSWGCSERISKHLWLWVPAFARFRGDDKCRQSDLSAVAQRAKAEATKQPASSFRDDAKHRTRNDDFWITARICGYDGSFEFKNAKRSKIIAFAVLSN